MVKLHRITLADGRTVDIADAGPWNVDPYVRGAEAAFMVWRNFMRGRTPEVAYDPPRYLLDAKNEHEEISLRAGFHDNMRNAGLIEASR